MLRLLLPFGLGVRPLRRLRLLPDVGPDHGDGLGVAEAVVEVPHARWEGLAVGGVLDERGEG